MRERIFEVYGLGQCPLDYLGEIDAYPPSDTKCEFTGLVIEGGGPTATSLVALSRWGVSTAFAGIVGDDDFGAVIRQLLEKEQVDTSGVLVRKGSDSQFAFIVAEPGMGTRTIFWRRPTGPPLGPDELDYDIIKSAKVVHTDCLYLDASLAACKAARQAGGRVVADAGTLREGTIDLARHSDYFVVSQTFARAFVGHDNPLEACRKLAEFGPGVTGVTLGAEGYVALVHGRVIARPAYAVEAMDTTGCGDAFHAGITYGVIQGWDAEKSLDFGAWAAAMVSRKLGGRAGIPTFKEVKEKGYL
jgi:sulfofructose kinase